jgi:hypothetical protein
MSSKAEILIIFNIPESFGSADLRRFFSDFVESEKFICFHFKRRPESKLSNFDRGKLLNDESAGQVKFNCCPVRLETKEAEKFMARYNQTHWTDDEGVDLDFKCFIVKGSEENHWNGLDESKPPSVLPRGNVGTCTKFLLESIRTCKLPPTIIKRLKLNFHERRRRAYATVPPIDYVEPKRHKSFYVPSSNTESKLGPSTSKANETPIQSDSSDSSKKKKKKEKVTFEDEDEEVKEKEYDSNDETEEWDRHRSLYNDVSARYLFLPLKSSNTFFLQIDISIHTL